MYVSVNYDSRGTFVGNSMPKQPDLYRKYEAYVVGFERNLTVQFHFEIDRLSCTPFIVEVVKRLSIIILVA